MFKKVRKPCLLCLALLLALTSFPVLAQEEHGQLTEAVIPGEALYNGIVIPEGYTFSVDPQQGDAVTVPYLLSTDEGGYAPELINIDKGRQLFVDDFLIESTTLSRSFYSAMENPSNPVFSPEAAWELTDAPSTACTSGGIWYDMEEKVYKMWYEAGFNNHMAYATSTDGIHWERPAINSDGSNLLVRQQQTDSFSVWIDDNADPGERYKLMIRSPNSSTSGNLPATLYTSANGLNWTKRGQTGMMQDRSTFFFNPFLELWIFSIRGTQNVKWGNETYRPRLRLYSAASDFLKAGRWEDQEPILWIKPDSSDEKDRSVSNEIPQLYNFDSIAYESVMLGLFQMWYGPHNDEIAKTGNPKITELQVGYSRDGFYYDRPNREAVISASREEGTWNYGYLQSATGGVIVYDDEIRIYYSGFSGDCEVNGHQLSGAYVGGAVGYATLRRDGFASMDGSGTLLTKPLTVSKEVKYLFVNANASKGSLRAEILDAQGRVLDGYGADDCNAMCENSTKVRLSWGDGKTLEQLQGKQFRIRFFLDQGELYSFWLSADENGASGGEMAAGYVSSEQGGTGEPSAPEPLPPVDEEQPPKQNTGLIIGLVCAAAAAAGGGAAAVLIVRKKRAKHDENTV